MSLNRYRGIWRLSAVRQALSLLGVFTAISFLAWGGTFWLVHREMLQAVDARLEERMDAATQMLAEDRGLPAPADGQTASLVSNDWPEGFLTSNSDGPGPEMRYLMRTTPSGNILLGENTERQDELSDILAGGMRVSLLASLVITVITGLWMARRSQARLGLVNSGLAKVARGQLETRISLEGEDDLSLLAERINDTTERLDHAMTQMRVQASNIAHDLRTPLARLRAQIESNLTALIEKDRPVTPDDLGAALEQIDHINGTFNALLRLARIESGAGRDGFVRVDLGAIADQVADTFSPVLEDAKQSLVISVDSAGHTFGDPELIAQLIANLLQNAMRYGPDGQQISLAVNGPCVSVLDQGPGIPLSEREKVMQPLYQGQSTRQGPGFGIGLSLVRAISEMHGAKFSLSDGDEGRGLAVTVEFPTLTEVSA